MSNGRSAHISVTGGLTVMLSSGPPIMVGAGPDGCRWVDVRRAVAPAFPSEALAAGRPGVVGVDLTIGEDGVPTDATAHGARDPVFEKAALIAAREWRFNMNVPEGRAERCIMLLFTFEIADTAGDDAADAERPIVFELPWNVYITARRDTCWRSHEEDAGRSATVDADAL